MIQVNISEFRTNLLKYLKNVQRGGQISITSKGTALATVIPPVSQRDTARTELSKLAKTAVIHDVVSPVETDWDVMK